jgi:hypothetical protein
VKYLWVWVFTGLSATLVACSGDDHPPPLAAFHALPECPNLDYSTCDTRQAACQTRLLSIAGCVYGVRETPDVPIRVVSEQQLVDDLAAAQSEAPDQQDAADLPHIERALADLKLLQPGDLTADGGSTAQIADSIDGVYQDAEHGIALVDRGMPKDSAESDAVLVHEFVHAIQDAQYGLDDWQQQYASDVDTALALRSVSEGQATYAQFRVVFAMSGRDVDRIDWPRTLSAFRDDLSGKAFADPSPYLASITTFPYALGTPLAQQRWEADGLTYHQGQFADPPLSTFEVLALGYGVSPAVRDTVQLEVPTADADYTDVDETVLGAFLLELCTHALGASIEDATAFGFGWYGDKLWIYAGPQQETVWLWELALSSDSQAKSVEKLAATAGLAVESQGARVFISGGDAKPDFLTSAGRAFLAAQ